VVGFIDYEARRVVYNKGITKVTQSILALSVRDMTWSLVLDGEGQREDNLMKGKTLT
jgi:hypothetical protein